MTINKLEESENSVLGLKTNPQYSDLKKKIGVAVITCNRLEFLENLLKSLIPCADSINNFVIINDGKPFSEVDMFSLDKAHSDRVDNICNLYIELGADWVDNETNLGVCKSKNKAMQHLLDQGCDYIFVIEDDMIILDPNIFSKYIEAHEKSGIHHFMFGYHGPANKANISKGKPVPRIVIDYKDFKIALNQHCVGAMCFYTRESLLSVGLNDEEFNKNNFEHVEHSYRLAKAKYSTPYWWWADLANSTDYIAEQACSEDNTVIHRDDWMEKIKWSALLFEKKHGYLPAWNNPVPDTPIEKVVQFLKDIKP